MIIFFVGSDREKAREALNVSLAKEEKKGARIVRITDAHGIFDFEAALDGGGLFAEQRAVVFDGLIGGDSDELSERLRAELPKLAKRDDIFFIIEGALDAPTRKVIEKHAEKTERFDLEKKKESTTIFALANALRAGDKKALWVGLMREYAKGAAPEAVHGVLFWAAKDIFLKSRGSAERIRAQQLIAKLAALPHAARRKGIELEFALEAFVLSKT